MKPATLKIDLEALTTNYRTLQSVTGVPVMPVVKADAYGLGAVDVTKCLMKAGARDVFVARCEEGLTLREALGPELTIWVLDGVVSGAASIDMMLAGLRPVFNHPEQTRLWKFGPEHPCGVQIDTGMNRLGFRSEDAPRNLDGVALVMSHLACSDTPAHPMNRKQRDAFAVVSALYPGAIRSLANSGGCFLGADYAFDAVRPGICLYGGGPEGRPDDRIMPVATFSAEILQIRDVPAGESVGYSRIFVADRPTRVATVGAGYADGVPRSSGARGRVYVGGEFRPILGRISMDVFAIDVTGLDVELKGEVELFGPHVMLDAAAEAAGTVSWELLTSVGPRVARLPQRPRRRCHPLPWRTRKVRRAEAAAANEPDPWPDDAGTTDPNG